MREVQTSLSSIILKKWSKKKLIKIIIIIIWNISFHEEVQFRFELCAEELLEEESSNLCDVAPKHHYHAHVDSTRTFFHKAKPNRRQ